MAAIVAVIEQCQFSDTNIHLIRKALKDVLYNLNNYSGLEHAVLSVTVWKGKEEQYITNMLDEMGDFQDQCTAIALLKAEWISGLNSYNQQLLAELKKEWIKKKIAMKQAIVKKLKADYAVLFEQRLLKLTR